MIVQNSHGMQSQLRNAPRTCRFAAPASDEESRLHHHCFLLPQSGLAGMIGTSSGFIESLPPKVGLKRISSSAC